MRRFKVIYHYAEADGRRILKGERGEDVCVGYDEASVLFTLINHKNLYSFDYIQEIDENNNPVYEEDADEV
jgi:hypothetical protein